MSVRSYFAALFAAALVGTFTFGPLAWAESRGGNSVQDKDVIGSLKTIVIKGSETFAGLAQRYDLGYVELLAANPGIDPWLPAPGAEVVLPLAKVLPNAPRRGIVINLAEQRLYYFPQDKAAVRSFPVGIGRYGCETPLGETFIAGKKAHPSWIPPESIRKKKPNLPAIVPPGPNNPLGNHALYLGWPLYVIHGTNRPLGIGRRVSHGCIRMYGEDVAWLFAEVAIGTPVRIIDQPVKVGWLEGELYLEVHPTQAQADALEEGIKSPPQLLPELEWRVHNAAGRQANRLDWSLIRRVAEQRRGLPARVTR